MKPIDPHCCPRRRRKEAHLPRLTELALEGHSCRVIAEKIRVPVTTVAGWLRELRQEWIAEAHTNTAELIAIAYARYESIYREAMLAWVRSQEARHVETIEDGGKEGEDGGPKTKRTRRPKPRWATAPFSAGPSTP